MVEHDGRWDGNYFENSGQEVSKEDAAALADSLQRMLNDTDRTQAALEIAAKLQRVIDDESVVGQTAPLNMLTYPAGYFRSMMKQFGQSQVVPWTFDDNADAYLLEFIAFCRVGSFRIG